MPLDLASWRPAQKRTQHNARNRSLRWGFVECLSQTSQPSCLCGRLPTRHRKPLQKKQTSGGLWRQTRGPASRSPPTICSWYNTSNKHISHKTHLPRQGPEPLCKLRTAICARRARSFCTPSAVQMVKPTDKETKCLVKSPKTTPARGLKSCTSTRHYWLRHACACEEL